MHFSVYTVVQQLFKTKQIRNIFLYYARVKTLKFETNRQMNRLPKTSSNSIFLSCPKT